MKDLLALAVESHGGQARWDAIRTVTAELSIGGALWAFKGKAGSVPRSAASLRPIVAYGLPEIGWYSKQMLAW
jgi:hypothetical protein